MLARYIKTFSCSRVILLINERYNPILGETRGARVSDDTYQVSSGCLSVHVLINKTHFSLLNIKEME
ncbi:MAG: hypothetical protein ACTSVI_15895 [Promethearchaeota archaeon]